MDVSRDRGVVIEPRNGEVVIGEDRDFQFGGGVRAGNLQFDGSDYAFDYASFSIELNAVEQCKLKVNDEEEKDVRGRAKRKRVRNKLENIEGVLRVDVPINRSGRLSEVYPQYPVLVTEAPSYVYWDDAAIEQGAYERERFRFVVEPSLWTAWMRWAGGAGGDGTLESAISAIEEQLRVMDDLYPSTTSAAGVSCTAVQERLTKTLTLNGDLQGGGKQFPDGTCRATASSCCRTARRASRARSPTASISPPPVPEVQRRRGGVV